MKTTENHGLTIINDAKSFPTESGRYDVWYYGPGFADNTGLMASFEGACREAAKLLEERADKVLVMDRVRGYAVAEGRA